MENLFYIDYNELPNFINKSVPIGVVIDTREIKKDEFNNFMIKLYEDKEYHLIEKVIVKTEATPETLQMLIFSKNIYYMFYNELDIREAISNLEESKKKQILGGKVCSTGVDILKYRVIGISNLLIGSPLINDSKELEMLEKIGYTLFAIPNYDSSFKDEIDPNWIRPEGLAHYDKIKNWILFCSNSTNINTIFNAYNRQAWLGKISDFLINFDKSYNIYKDLPNFMSPTFDIKRTVCLGDCLYCDSCKREFELSKKITTKEKVEEK